MSSSLATPTTESAYPRSWDFSTDGELVAGYVETRSVATKDGPRALVELKVRGTNEPVTVWLSAAVLKSRFREELQRRVLQGQDDFSPGEEITIRRGKEKRPSAAGSGYWPYTVTFEHAAKLSAKDVLLGDEDDVDDGGGVEGVGDDAIPFWPSA